MAACHDSRTAQVMISTGLPTSQRLSPTVLLTSLGRPCSGLDPYDFESCSAQFFINPPQLPSSPPPFQRSLLKPPTAAAAEISPPSVRVSSTPAIHPAAIQRRAGSNSLQGERGGRIRTGGLDRQQSTQLPSLTLSLLPFFRITWGVGISPHPCHRC